MAAPEITQVVMDANTFTTIANNINSLYSNAISQLTSYTFGVVALVGVLIPVLVTLIQWRSLKAEKENLESHIADEITKAKSIIRDELMVELKRLIESEEGNLFSRVETKFQKLENKLACAEAASFHLQGNANVTNKFYGLAAEDFCFATMGFLRGEDELNGQRTLRLLIESCLPNIDKVHYEQLDLDGKIDELINFLKKKNQNSRYADQITTINRERKVAKTREAKAATGSGSTK